MVLKVAKRPGMEAEDVLLADKEASSSGGSPQDYDEGEEDDSEGMWGMLFGGGNKKKAAAAAKAKAAVAATAGRSDDSVVATTAVVAGGDDDGATATADVPAVMEDTRDVINVFTVASGHMYERLQKIMFLSVVKNTKRCEGAGSGGACGRVVECMEWGALQEAAKYHVPQCGEEHKEVFVWRIAERYGCGQYITEHGEVHVPLQH